MSKIRLNWSKQEEEVLKKVYPLFLRGEIDANLLQKIFPYRSFSAIQQRASLLGLSNQKGEVDIEFLQKNLGGIEI